MKTIEQFVEGLAGIAERDFTTGRVEDYLRGNPVKPETMGPYLHYEPTHYTRNLIHRTPLFEPMALGWEIGQASRIHNHAGQQYWMAVPIGRKTGHCELRPANRLLMDPAHPAHSERPIHAVLNLAEYGARATSLHVYSKPYDRCLVYQLENKSYMEVPLRQRARPSGDCSASLSGGGSAGLDRVGHLSRIV